MKTKFLFPNKFRLIGYVLFIPSAILGLLVMYNEFSFSWLALPQPENPSIFSMNDYNLTNELALAAIIVSLLFIAFAKEKKEDEYVQSLRSNSLVLAVIINYVVLFIANITLYDTHFLEFLFYNLFTPLLAYIVIYNVRLFRDKQLLNTERDEK